MALWPAFVGAAYSGRSRTINDEACVNLYLETTRTAPTGDGSSHGAGTVKPAALLGTPGLKKFNEATTTVGCRGTYPLSEAFTVGIFDSAMTVIGSGFYLFNPRIGTPIGGTPFGVVADDGRPVTFATNGRAGVQFIVCSGGTLYIFDPAGSGVMHAVVLPFAGKAVMCGFLDGYFLVLEENTPTIWFSALEDGTSWDALDFFTRSSTPDDIVSFKVVSGRIWTFGRQSIEVFYNSGDALTPFIPYPGSVLPYGTVSPWAVVLHGRTLVWIAQSQEVGSVPSIMSVTFGGFPQAVSTPAIDLVLARATTLTDVEGFTYAQEGHVFVGFTFPSVGVAGETWVVDVSEGYLWHQRAAWNSAVGRFEQWAARGLCAIGPYSICGDWTTGNLYTIDLDTYTDNTRPIVRKRRAPYLSNDNQWLFVDQIELGIESGVGLNSGQGSDPQVMLSISRDSAKSWGPIELASIGKQGEDEARAVWRRLGRVRADRLVIEVTMSDPVKAVWGPGLWLRVTPGSGSL